MCIYFLVFIQPHSGNAKDKAYELIFYLDTSTVSARLLYAFSVHQQFAFISFSARFPFKNPRTIQFNEHRHSNSYIISHMNEQTIRFASFVYLIIFKRRQIPSRDNQLRICSYVCIEPFPATDKYNIPEEQRAPTTRKSSPIGPVDWLADWSTYACLFRVQAGI